jgi:hypothetical protein
MIFRPFGRHRADRRKALGSAWMEVAECGNSRMLLTSSSHRKLKDTIHANQKD